MVHDDLDLGPIPAIFMEPWIEENAQFLLELEARSSALGNAHQKRDGLHIRRADLCDPIELAAVDAGVADVSIGDMLSILIQAVHVSDDGMTTFGHPIRATGIDGNDLSMSRTPLRILAECQMLSPSTGVTIADLSFWSLLMDVNKLITLHEHGGSGNDYIAKAMQGLVYDGGFLSVITNPNVISMSKVNQSCRLSNGLVSDRELLGRILEPGEFLQPELLVDTTDARFGVQQKGFTNDETEEIKNIYKQQLAITFFKPHAWTRAFRIEGSLSRLDDDSWLMPVLASISRHTEDRMIVEPYPQFMADWTAHKLQAIKKLYGRINFHRCPYFDPARTLS